MVVWPALYGCFCYWWWCFGSIELRVKGKVDAAAVVSLVVEYQGTKLLVWL